MNDKLKGCLFGIVAAVTYGMNPLFALPLYKQGVSADALLFYRYGFAFVLLGVFMKLRGKSFAISRKDVVPLLVTGNLMAFSSLLLFLAFLQMDAGIASTILFIYPVIVAVIMAVFFREKITVVTTVSIVLALFGIALLYRGGDGESLSFIGVVLVLFAALLYALYIISVRHSKVGKMDGELLSFYAFLIAIFVFLIRLLSGDGVPWLPGWSALGCILALAVITTVVSFLCTTLAVRYIGATPTSILGAFEPLTAVFFGVTVFGEQLTFRIGVGIVFIILAVTLIVLGKPLANQLLQLSKKTARSR